MISKFHRVHISIEIFTKEYIFLTSYMHWKFQFIHSKIVDQKKKIKYCLVIKQLHRNESMSTLDWIFCLDVKFGKTILDTIKPKKSNMLHF